MKVGGSEIELDEVAGVAGPTVGEIAGNDAAKLISHANAFRREERQHGGTGVSRVGFGLQNLLDGPRGGANAIHGVAEIGQDSRIDVV
jgi:hypothetical protein